MRAWWDIVLCPENMLASLSVLSRLSPTITKPISSEPVPHAEIENDTDAGIENNS